LDNLNETTENIIEEQSNNDSESIKAPTRNKYASKRFGALYAGLAGILTVLALGVNFFFAEPAEAAPVLIDVRTAEEFALGHVYGAINIPLNLPPDEFHARLAELDLGVPFSLNCGTGARADRVAEFMSSQGFTVVNSYSLDEALESTGGKYVGDLEASRALNPTRYDDLEEFADGAPMCALTGESLFGTTRD